MEFNFFKFYVNNDDDVPYVYCEDSKGRFFCFSSLVSGGAVWIQCGKAKNLTQISEEKAEELCNGCVYTTPAYTMKRGAITNKYSSLHDVPLFREKKTRTNIFLCVVLNILGFCIGTVAIFITYSIAEWLFIDVIGSIGFISNILSWPVDYNTYVFCGIIAAEALIGMRASFFISKLYKPNIAISCIFLTITRGIIWIVTIIKAIAEFGFTLDDLSMLFMVVVFLGIVPISFVINDGDEF